MRFVIAGGSGFLGTRLRHRLTRLGHDVVVLTRGTPTRTEGEAPWDPYSGEVGRDLVELVESADVVVNLAGSPTLGNPHSRAWARDLRHSRVTTTRVLAEAIAESERRPAFLAGNGISFYGDQGARRLPETAPSLGSALLTEVTREWQAATGPAEAAGARVCILRTGPVLDAAVPPLRPLRLLFRRGLGGRIGDGSQYFPVISARDWVDGVIHTAMTPSMAGPVNLCCAQVPTNAEFTEALADAVGRRARLRAPAGVVRRLTGPMAPELLGSVRAVPQALLDAGYRFQDPDIVSILTTALADA